MAAKQSTSVNDVSSSPNRSRMPVQAPASVLSVQTMPLTPPRTPTRGKHLPDAADGSLEPLDSCKNSLDHQKSPARSLTDDGVLICPYHVEVVKDIYGQQQSFGDGAWSTVWQGTCRARADATNDGLLTPPNCSLPAPPLLVAIKQPAGKAAKQVIDNEAKILSRLQAIDEDERHVVDFIGFLPDTSALVLRAHPLSLDAYIRSCAVEAATNFSTETMRSPILGSASTWLDLAIPLITTLDWLHNTALVVHGDIKPGNVLLRPSPSKHGFAFTPLLIDFSSSQRLDTDEIQPNTLSAITQEFTAPELLSSAVLGNPTSTATTASDVFSMAVTLLVAATGEPLVYPSEYSAFQRRELAKQGYNILNNVRNFGSTRIPKQGVVWKALEQAVLKVDMGRVSIQKWLEVVDHLRMDTSLDS